MEEFRFVSIGMYKLICIVCISMYSFQWFVFNGIFIKINFSMIRRPDHRPGVDVETRASRSWLCKLVAHALSKASLLALSHRAGNGSRVTQRNERQAAEYAGGLHHRLGRERAFSFRCEPCCATTACFHLDSSPTGFQSWHIGIP